MRITKVYTRTGDGGETGLVDGSRVSKGSLRVEAYGEIDELNSWLGLVRGQLQDAELDAVLGIIQNDLFIVGADLASPLSVSLPRIEQSFIDALEEWADSYLEELPPLKEFILPGGAPAGALLHLARTVARRAERQIVRLAAIEEINPLTIGYVNRLSDLLFVLARLVNQRAAIPEQSVDFSARGKFVKPARTTKVAATDPTITSPEVNE
jgi:cob(I)alamin adenosyltransferase